MKPVHFYTVVLFLVLLASCGGSAEAKTEKEVKEEMPAELKDSAVIINDEQSALDKLNSAMDSTQKR